MAQALLAEAIEVLVVKEELGDEVVRTGLLLEVERAEALLLRGRLDVALRVAGGAYAEVRAAGAQVGDEVGGVRKVPGLATGGAIAAQGEHVLHARGGELLHVGVHVLARGAQAGEVRERRHAQVALDLPGYGDGVCRVAGAARGVGDRYPVRSVRRHLAGHGVRGLERHVPLGRENLERERLMPRELVCDPHASPSPRNLGAILLAAGTGEGGGSVPVTARTYGRGGTGEGHGARGEKDNESPGALVGGRCARGGRPELARTRPLWVYHPRHGGQTGKLRTAPRLPSNTNPLNAVPAAAPSTW